MDENIIIFGKHIHFVIKKIGKYVKKVYIPGSGFTTIIVDDNQQFVSSLQVTIDMEERDLITIDCETFNVPDYFYSDDYNPYDLQDEIQSIDQIRIYPKNDHIKVYSYSPYIDNDSRGAFEMEINFGVPCFQNCNEEHMKFLTRSPVFNEIFKSIIKPFKKASCKQWYKKEEFDSDMNEIMKFVDQIR